MNVEYRLPAPESNAISHNLCIGCGLCALNCPTQALRMEIRDISPLQVYKNPSFVPHLCVHCGRCAAVCPTGTIFEYRTEQILHEVQQQKIHSIVFFCNGLNALHSTKEDVPIFHDRGKIPPDMPLLDSRKMPILQEGLHLQAGCMLETVRCTGRLGPRFLLRLALLGVQRMLIFACPPRVCQYAHGRPGLAEHAEALTAMLTEYGVESLQISVFQEEFGSTQLLQERINQHLLAQQD